MKMKKILFSSLVLSTLALTLNVSAATGGITPAGNSKAPQGGDFKINLGDAPTTLNALSSTDAYAADVQGYVLESLLNRNPDSYEWEPGLAKEWKIAKDGLSFEFTLRDGVKWHDGKPLTAEDVKFTFDAIMEPTNKYKTAQSKPYYENIKAVEVLAPNKVKFTVGKPYFDNFTVCAGMSVVPMHLYKDPSKEQEKLLNKTLVGTGPWILDSFDRAKSIILKRNPNWWGNAIPELKGKYNFNTITLRFIKEEAVELQMIEKGDIDYLGLGAEAFMKKTSGPKWGKEVIKVKTQNKQAWIWICWIQPAKSNVCFKENSRSNGSLI
jgi:ABC-type transport system substrate-binding protein